MQDLKLIKDCALKAVESAGLSLSLSLSLCVCVCVESAGLFCFFPFFLFLFSFLCALRLTTGVLSGVRRFFLFLFFTTWGHVQLDSRVRRRSEAAECGRERKREREREREYSAEVPTLTRAHARQC